VETLYGKALGVRDFGPLQNEQHLDACLQANGFDPAVRPGGIRPVAGQASWSSTRPGGLRNTGWWCSPATRDANHPGKLFDKVVGAK
jgi:hypothetical protein